MNLSLLCLFLWFGHGQAADNAHWSAERIQEIIPLQAVQRIRVLNPYGDVRIRSNAENEVLLIGMIQKHDDAAGNFKLKVHTEANQLLIEPAFWGGGLPSEKRYRADLTLLIPAGYDLAVENEKHLIEAKGLRNNLYLRSHSGKVVFATHGVVDVETFQGDVHGQLKSLAAKSHSKISSTHGLVAMQIPADVDVKATLRTEMLLSTDFSMDVTFLNFAMKQGIVALGQGKASLELASRRGDVRLLRLSAPIIEESKH